MSRIGKYEIQAELGRGGFGRVFRAFDPTVGRLVAIKVLASEGDKSLLSRFRNEAAAAGKLRHKNIVTIYEYGEHKGLPFLAMEFLEGEDLQRIISSRRPLSLLDKVGIMSQVAEGLYCAHQNGVIHRDVKPANIMVLADGTVKIMDFGIARVLREDATRLTRKGDLIGTILYMSPEQFTSSEVDALCDIFAYGVIYYELLTGKHPFKAADAAALMYRITVEEPEPLRAMAPECPQELEELVLRALHKDRDLRYQSMREVQLDAEPILISLQQERAAELITGAQGLFEKQELEEAQRLVMEGLDLDPSNRAGRQLREALQKKIQRVTLQPRLDALIKSANDDLSARRFAEAIQGLESALRLDRTNSDILRLLDDAKSALERSRKAARLIAEGRRDYQQGKLEASRDRISEALREDPSNQEAQLILKRLEDEIRTRERERKLKEAIDKAAALIALHAFDAAVEELEQIVGERPDSREAAELLARARAEKAESERRQQFRSEMAAATDLLREQRFEQAVETLGDIAGRFPDEEEVADLLSYARREWNAQRRAEGIRAVARDASGLRDNADFDGAIRVLEQGLKAYTGESSLARLLQSVRVAKADWERQRAVESILRTADELAAALRFAEALEAVEAGLREYPGEAALEPRRSAIDGQWAAHRRAEAIASARGEVRERIERGDQESAVAVARGALDGYADDPEFAALLQEAERALTAKREAIAACVRDVRSLADAREFDRAVAAADAGLASWPGAAGIVEARAAALAGKAAWEREQAIAGILGQVQERLEDNEFEAAIEALRQGLAAYPAEERLARLLGEAEGRLRARREAVANLEAEARRLAGGELFDDALAVLENGAGAYPGESALEKAREDIVAARATWMREQAVRALCGEARRLMSEARFEEAAAQLRAGAPEYSGDLRIAVLLAEAERKFEAQRRAAAVARAREEVRVLCEARQYGRAVEAAEAALAAIPGEAVLRQLRDTTVRARETWELIERGDYEAAIARASGDPGLAGLLEEAGQRLRAREAAAAEARRLAAAESFDEALAAIAKEPALEALRRDIGRERTICGLHDAARERIAAKHYDEAAADLRMRLREYPGERRFATLLVEAEARSLIERGDYDAAMAHVQADPALGPVLEEARKRREARDAAAAEARRLAAEEAFDEALATIAREPALDALRREIGRERTICRLRDAIRERIAAKEFDAAAAEARERLREYPGDRRFEALLAEAEARALIERGDYDPAIARVENEPGLSALREEARQRVQARDAAAAEARRLAAAQSFEEALAAIAGEPALGTLRQEIEGWRGIAGEARSLIGAGDYDGAIARLEREPALADLLNEARRRRDARDAAAAEARRLAAAESFEQALAAIAGEPALEPLKQEIEAHRRIAAEARTSIAAGDYDAAIARVENEPLLAGLLKEARQRRQARDAAAAEARRLTAAESFDEALAAIANEPALGEVRQEIERERSICALRDALRERMAAGHIDSAIDQIHALLRVHPGDRRFVPLLAEAEARSLIRGGDYDGAFARLKDDPGNAVLEEARQRRQARDAAAAEARRLAAAEAFDAALAAIANEPALGDLRREIERERTICEIRDGIRERIAEGQFDATIQEIRGRLREYPGEQRFGTLLAETEARSFIARGDYDSAIARLKDDRANAALLEEAQRRRQARDAAAAEARRLAAAGSFDAALAAIANEPALGDLRREIERERSICEIRDGIRERIAAGQFDAAVQEIRDRLREYPGEQRFGTLLAEAEARSLIARGDYDSASARLKDDRANAALLEEAQRRRQARDTAAAEARRLAAAEAFDEALAAISNEPALGDLRREIEARRDLAADAHALIDRGDYDGALARLKDDAGLAALREQTERRRAARDAAAEQARRLAAAASFDEALAAIASEPALGALRQEIEGHRRIAAEARTLIERGEYDSAITRLKDQPALAALLEEARQRRQARDRAAAVQTARERIASGQFDEAAAELQARLREYPGEPQLAVLLAEAEARAAMARGELDGAVARLRKAVTEHPGAGELAALLAEAEKRNAAAAICREAQSLIACGDLDVAAATLREAIGRYPGAPDLAALLDEAGRALQARDEAIAELEREARRLLVEGRYGEAADVLALRAPALGANDRLAALAGSVQSHAEARRLIDAGKPADAIRLLREIPSRYPNEEPSPALLREAGERQARSDAVAAVRAEALRLAEAGDFDAALAEVRKSLAAYQGEPALEEAERAVLERQAAWQREQARQRVLRDAAALRGERRYDDALRLLEESGQQFPGDRQLPALAADIRAERDRRQRNIKAACDGARESVRKGRHDEAAARLRKAAAECGTAPELAALMAALEIIGESRRLAAQDDFDGALRTLEDAMRAHPNETVLDSAREAVLAAREAHKLEREIAEAAARAAALCDEGQLDEARKAVQAAVAAFGDAPALAALRERIAAAREHKRRRDDDLRRVADADVRLRAAPGPDDVEPLVREARQIASQYPGDAAIESAAAAVVRQWNAMREVRDFRARNDYEAIARTCEARLREFPEHVFFSAAKREAEERRKQQIAGFLAQLEARVASEPDPDRRVQMLEEALRAHPGEQRLKAELRFHQSRRDLAQSILDKARAHEAAGEFDEALQQLSALQSTFRNYPGIDAEIRRVTALRDGAAQEAALAEARRLLADAERLCSQRRYEEACHAFALAHQSAGVGDDFRREVVAAMVRHASELAAADWRSAELLVRNARALDPRCRVPETVSRAVGAGRRAENEPPVEVAVPESETVLQPGPAAAAPRGLPRWLVAGGAALAVVAIIAAGVVLFTRRTPEAARIPVQVVTSPEGATVKLGNLSCVTPNCRLEVAAGEHRLEVSREGYEPSVQLVRADPAHPENLRGLRVDLTPLPNTLQVSTNLASGTVWLNGNSAGQLQDGQFALDKVPAGNHTLRVASPEGELEFAFRTAAGEPPRVVGPLRAKDVKAVVAAESAGGVRLHCNCGSERVSVDGGAAAEVPNSGLDLGKLGEGAHELTFADGNGRRNIVLPVRPAPGLNVFLSSDRNAGTLVVESGQDDVRVFLNGRPYRRTTAGGILRIPLDVQTYEVRVEKPGFRPPAPQRVEVRKGEERRVAFQLDPVPQNSMLSVRGGVPGTRILAAGREIGTISANGTFLGPVPPGDHTVEFVRGNSRKSVRRNFTAGGTVGLGREEVEVAEVIQPPAIEPPPVVSPGQPRMPLPPAPAPPEPPDVSEWKRVSASHNPAELADFARKYPESRFAEQAAKRAEQLDWEAARTGGKAQLQAFLGKYSKGAFAAEAAAALKKLEEAEQASTDSRAVLDVLRRYAAAWEARNPEELLALNPALRNTRFRDILKTTVSLRYTLQPAGDPQITGDRATITCRRVLEQALAGVKPIPPQQNTVTFTLRKTGGRWSIENETIR